MAPPSGWPPSAPLLAPSRVSGRLERIDGVDPGKPPEAAITCIDDADAMLTHQRRQMIVGHLVTPSSILTGCTKKLPETLPFPSCADVRSVEQRFHVGGRLSRIQRPRQYGRVGDDSQVAKQHRPE